MMRKKWKRKRKSNPNKSLQRKLRHPVSTNTRRSPSQPPSQSPQNNRNQPAKLLKPSE